MPSRRRRERWTIHDRSRARMATREYSPVILRHVSTPPPLRHCITIAISTLSTVSVPACTPSMAVSGSTGLLSLEPEVKLRLHRPSDRAEATEDPPVVVQRVVDCAGLRSHELEVAPCRLGGLTIGHDDQRTVLAQVREQRAGDRERPVTRVDEGEVVAGLGSRPVSSCWYWTIATSSG